MKQKISKILVQLFDFISKNSVSVLIAKSNKAQLLRNKLSKILAVITLLLLFITSQNIKLLSLKRIKFL